MQDPNAFPTAEILVYTTVVLSVKFRPPKRRLSGRIVGSKFDRGALDIRWARVGCCWHARPHRPLFDAKNVLRRALLLRRAICATGYRKW